MKRRKFTAALLLGVLLAAAGGSVCRAESPDPSVPVSVNFVPKATYRVVIPERASLNYDGRLEYDLGDILAEQIVLPEGRALQVSIVQPALRLYREGTAGPGSTLSYQAALAPAGQTARTRQTLLTAGEPCGLYAAFDSAAARQAGAGKYVSRQAKDTLRLSFELVEVP